MTSVGRLLGREEQLGVLEEAIDAAASLVLVTGDAGIGKSRLVAEAVRDARARGVVALVGRCVSLTGKLPLLPFVEALSDLGDGAATHHLQEVPASLRPALTALMPGTLADPPGQAPSSREEHDERGAWERERLFLAVGALLSPPARTGPLVVVIEDLHWADPFTLDLLTYLVSGTRTGATFLVTLRTDERPVPEPVLRAVAELQRLDSTVTVDLGPLPPAVAARQVDEILGGQSSPDLVAEVVTLGGGNPFFTEQLCRHRVARRQDEDGLGRAMPPRLAGFLRARVRGLSEPALRTLLTIGVAGIPLTAAQVAVATGSTTVEVTGSVRELSDAALLAPAERGRLAPRHALLAAAVAEETDPLTLAEAHARVAEILEETGDPALAAAAAGHWAAAGREDDELRAALVAAPVAEQLADFGAAADLWTRAYALALRSAERGAADRPDVLGIVVAAVRAMAWAGRGVDAHELAEDAFRHLSPVAESPSGGALRYWVGQYRAIRNHEAGVGMLGEALRVLTMHPPTPELSRCLRLLGRIEDMSGRSDVGLALVERAVTAAREGGSASDEASAITTMGQLLLHLGRGEEVIERVGALATASRLEGDARARGILAIFESDVLLQTSGLDRAQAVALSAGEVMTRAGYGGSFDASVLRYNAGEAALERGRTAQVLGLVEQLTTGLAPDIDSTGDHLLRALADLHDGHLAAAVERVERVRIASRAQSSTEDVRLTGQGVARILLWAREPERAGDTVTEDLEWLAGTDQARWCGELLTLGAAAAADLAEAARARGDVVGMARAEQTLQWLSRWADDCTPDPFEPVLEGGREGIDRLQWTGELSRAAGEADPGVWESAALAWEAQGRVHRAAYCWWRHAQAHVDLGHLAASVAPAVQRAHELAEEMLPQRAAIEELAARANIRLTRAPGPLVEAQVDLPVALTTREREILQHVVAGRSNAQIARDLFVSPKTVSVHVSNLLRKIGVANRLQAAAWAERAGADQGAKDQGA